MPSPLGRVYPLQAYAVLGVAGIQDGDGVAIDYLDHVSGEGVRVNGPRV
jgi:hypothetical protein